MTSTALAPSAYVLAVGRSTGGASALPVAWTEVILGYAGADPSQLGDGWR